jgi:hypothetical protein
MNIHHFHGMDIKPAPLIDRQFFLGLQAYAGP